jgi:glycosyltransferase involved in cell wall biosynthesis
MHLPGIGRTALELALAFDEKNTQDINIDLYCQTFRGSIPARFRHLKKRNIFWPKGERYDRLKECAPMLEVLAPYDLLHIPHNFEKVHRPDKTVVTIHDALFFAYPEDFLGHDYLCNHLPGFARNCQAIATPSISSKSDIVNYLDVPPEKVTVIPWGVDRSIFNAADKQGAFRRVAGATGENRPYFLSVSCDIGRKNTITLLHAFRAALNSCQEHNLLLVWGKPPDDYLKEFSKEIEAGRIMFLKHVPDDFLGDLYAGASASFFPSRYEGFGLPVLESLACGTPVVTCRNSSLTEVGGGAALYVDPGDIDGMADLMRSFDRGIGFGNEHDEKACLAQAARFTWEKAASDYIAFYKASLF